MNDKIFKFPSPSRGSYFSIITGEAYVLPQTFVFPSPSRGSYFSMPAIAVQCTKCKDVSVPFPGILFLNVSVTTAFDDYKAQFPSPSRGSYFSINIVIIYMKITGICFRPLPRDLISQWE